MQKRTKLAESLTLAVTYSLVWMSGFTLAWTLKWILAAMLGDPTTVWSQLIGQVRFRLSGAAIDFPEPTVRNAIELNLRQYLAQPLGIAAFAILAISLGWLVMLSARRRTRSIGTSSLAISLVAIAMPLAWYATLRNHSVIHPWMAYRSLSGTVVVIAVIAVSTYNISPDTANRYRRQAKSSSPVHVSHRRKRQH